MRLTCFPCKKKRKKGKKMIAVTKICFQTSSLKHIKFVVILNVRGRRWLRSDNCGLLLGNLSLWKVFCAVDLYGPKLSMHTLFLLQFASLISLLTLKFSSFLFLLILRFGSLILQFISLSWFHSHFGITNRFTHISFTLEFVFFIWLFTLRFALFLFIFLFRSLLQLFLSLFALFTVLYYDLLHSSSSS